MDDAATLLQRVTLHALHHPEFRAAWDGAVRQAAGQAVGELLAAEASGVQDTLATYEAYVPVPDGMSRVEVFTAFMAAVDGEVARALGA